MSAIRIDRPERNSVKPRPRWLKALGDDAMPPTLLIGDTPYQLEEVFKHDSWAATAVYVNGVGKRRIVKLHRRSSLLGIPMAWLGRMTARHEIRLLAALVDLPGIPPLDGPVTIAGEVMPNAVARAYIPGHPLGNREQVADDFFPRLRSMLRTMHSRGMVYVDLHKRENILVDQAGGPCLIDFQISLSWPAWLPRSILFRLLSKSDDYHLMKHWTRCRPDQCGVDEAAFRQHIPWWIRAHRLLARPVRELRRRILVKVGVRTGKGKVESELFTEHALRAENSVDRSVAS